MGLLFLTRPLLGVAGLLLVGEALLGCSASSSEPGSGGPVGRLLPSAASAAAAGASEAERVQAFLDRRYLPSDVRHSFETKFGEMVDCIDFFAQPGVRALAARGRPITSLPAAASHTPAAPNDPLSDVKFLGQPDASGRPRACPAGTVPILRVTAQQIEAAGGLDAFGRQHRKVHGPPVAALVSAQSYAHVAALFAGGPGITAATSTTGVFDPTVTNDDAAFPHSLSQTWMITGTQVTTPETLCTTDCIQSVEVGWNVDPLVYSGTAAPLAAHFFIFATNDGYTTGCYNNVAAGDTCLAWTSTPQATLTPGQVLSAGSPGGGQVEMTFETAVNPGTGWEIFLGDPRAGDEIGYYTDDDYSGTMRTSATTFEVGAEVYDPTSNWLVPMAGGASPTAGFGQAGYHHDYAAYNGGSSFNYDFTMSTPEQPSYYNSSAGPGPGSPSWANYFYVGDEPLVFWGQSINTTFSPIGTWASGYVGECPASNGLGSPLTGVSRYQSGIGQAHAVLCGPEISVTSSGCNARSFDPGDSRGDTDNGVDWDPGFAKGECAANEFVAGVAQSTSGSVDSILCCPGSFTRASCEAQVFATNNSPGWHEPDWDYGFYKGECPAGQVAAGVSASGPPHALYCCTP